jgi:hypothetical protein
MIQSKKVRTGHHGPYNVSGRTRNSKEIVSILDEETSADKEVDGYFRTLSNFLLPNELQDIYNMCQQSKVPECTLGEQSKERLGISCLSTKQ